MIQHIENFFQTDQLDELELYFKKTPWTWGYHSNSGLFRGIPHWSIMFAGIQTKQAEYYNCEHELPSNIVDIWNLVKPIYFQSDILVRCYANGITHGLDQKLHVDDTVPTSKTFILYINKVWNVDWAGETVIWDNSCRTITSSVIPKFNTGIIIPGNCWHGVRPVSRYCDDLRITLMFKTRSKESSLKIIQ